MIEILKANLTRLFMFFAAGCSSCRGEEAIATREQEAYR